MTCSYKSLLLLLTFGALSIECAKILAIFPFPGPSQYFVAEPYLKTLAARGHQLTVLSHFPQKQPLKNFHDILLKYEGYEDLINASMNGDEDKQMEFYANFFRNATLSVLENTAVQALINDKSQHFDLVITEVVLTEAIYALAPHFNAHLIGISTYGTDGHIDEFVGNTSPLSYIPLVTSNFTDHMTFCERLKNIGLAIFDWYFINFPHMQEQRRIYRKHFPHLPYELDEIYKNFSLILLNQHFSLSFPRPYVPNMIEVGGMYIKPKPTALPKDIEDFINGSQHGVIYFSMGSNVKSKYFSADKMKAVLNVFASLKQRVLWKFEETELPGKPDNVFIAKWFPQADILAHPNVKLFITHAGLLSTIEAIYYAKPVIGIPVFYDQFYNAQRAKKMGFGLCINYQDLNEADLRRAVESMLNNNTYTTAVQTISARYHDQPMKPMDVAIYWTEYILRHQGAEFMRVSALKLNLIQYFNLDVLICGAAILMIILYAIYFLISILCKTCKKYLFQSQEKVKRN